MGRPKKPAKKQVQKAAVARPTVIVKQSVAATPVVISSPEPVVVKPAPLLEIAVHDPTLVERLMAWLTTKMG
jgi:hypothetical protein